MTELKTIKDIECPCADCADNLREEAIKHAKERDVFCSYCGKMMIPDYEGELSCPDFWDDWKMKDGESKHSGLVSSWGDLDTVKFILEFFNLSEEDIK